ncbi:MAG TPA: hypothetical protein VN368_02685 [Candidatus Methylomirabilis sp.]|nr:hypothetical protein [Candidatus Methylomirabilis sp.]
MQKDDIIRFLIKKGLLSIEKLDERKKQVAERLVKNSFRVDCGSCTWILNATSTLLTRKLRVANHIMHIPEPKKVSSVGMSNFMKMQNNRIQRCSVPGRLPCSYVADWLNTNSFMHRNGHRCDVDILLSVTSE